MSQSYSNLAKSATYAPERTANGNRDKVSGDKNISKSATQKIITETKGGKDDEDLERERPSNK